MLSVTFLEAIISVRFYQRGLKGFRIRIGTIAPRDITLIFWIFATIGFLLARASGRLSCSKFPASAKVKTIKAALSRVDSRRLSSTLLYLKGTGRHRGKRGTVFALIYWSGRIHIDVDGYVATKAAHSRTQDVTTKPSANDRIRISQRGSLH